jgi:hypothetical protein
MRNLKTATVISREPGARPEPLSGDSYPSYLTARGTEYSVDSGLYCFSRPPHVQSSDSRHCTFAVQGPLVGKFPAAGELMMNVLSYNEWHISLSKFL